jgi:nucleoside-diphosphate-sugar epimerase
LIFFDLSTVGYKPGSIMSKTRIAILGSTSHIAKGLINNFLRGGEFCLHLFTRSPDRLLRFLEGLEESVEQDCVLHEGYDDFAEGSYDVVINCVGVGTLSKLAGNYSSYFMVTEKYDNLIIEHLLENPDTLYISISSGAVYGRELSAPANEDTVNHIHVNHITTDDYYAITRLNAETKHRAFGNLRIVDLRVFSYFSRFIDLTDGYFITEIMDCILNEKMLVTDEVNMVRDYIHTEDLFSIIRKCVDAGKINKAFDAVSSKPVEKREILDYFSLEYGLKYEISRFSSHASATGKKNIYCSNYNNVACIGYEPTYSSMDVIKQESQHILTGDWANV